MLEHVYLIALIPLAASLVILFGFKENPRSRAPYLGIAAMLWCFLQSCAVFHRVAASALPLSYEANMEWFRLPVQIAGKAFALPLQLGVLIDGPAALMLCVVTLVSLMVQIYSLGYMHGDPRLRRYYAFLSFFTASMLGLVVSSDLLVTFMCWELVGVSSYLLIGFWFEKPGPAYASKKAFITTKLGDCGLYVALLLLFTKTGTFQISALRESVAHGYLAGAAATAVALGMLLGCIGKSAQWPLFIWLPDAMEGPTPVSALIHAATMVAAGIYLVARTYFIYLASPVALETAAWIGLITAFLAATMAIVAYDIKRVLAFSTISQLGFMMCALGAGGYAAGLFHLTTHAFFKSLLFLGAGSVIHAVHTNDMRRMGGLSKKMPITFVTMVLATLAIAGVPPFAGYFSKELILKAVYQHSPAMFFLLAAAALLTAFYMTRLIMLTFLGAPREEELHQHAHESPASMTGPMMLLASLAVVSGMALAHAGFIERLLPLSAAAPAEELAAREFPEWLGAGVSVLGALSIVLGFLLYRGPAFETAKALKRRFSGLFELLENRYGFDAFFLRLVEAADALSRFCFWFDSQVVDRVFVDGWGLLTLIWAEAAQLVDSRLIDRTVDGFGLLSLDLGGGLRALVRDGQVQEYLMYVAIVVSLFAALLLMR